MSTESPLTDSAEHAARTQQRSAIGHPFPSVSTQETAGGAPWLLPSFPDPVAGSQAAFRSALNALSHPGRLHTLPDVARITAPAPLSPAMAALLLTLADSDTPIWLAPVFGEAVRRYLRFHNGCTLTDSPEKAAFAVLSCDTDPRDMGVTHDGARWPSLHTFAQGDLANPHESTTLLIELPHLADPAHKTDDVAVPGVETVTLRGPGIATTQSVNIVGLPSDFWRQWRSNRARFPQGVDAFLINDVTFCGLPRTTQRES